MGMAFIARDGSSQDARIQMTAQHRASFFAGVTHQDFADTQPELHEAGSACSEFLADEHAPSPRERAKQARTLGAICLVSFLAVVCFVAPLAAHFTAKAPRPQPAKPIPSLGVWA